MGKRGRGFYDGGHAGSTASAAFGSAAVITHMSPEDRKIMIDGFAKQVYAYFADRDVALAQHANAGNRTLNPRGRN